MGISGISRIILTLGLGLVVSLSPGINDSTDAQLVSNDTGETKLTDTEKEAEAEQLLQEARDLFIEDRPIDARAKLQQALQLAPKDYRTHMLLGTYYLGDVGHFQLADRYLRTAEKFFEEKHGSDKNDTLDPAVWAEHAQLLFLLSEARLNLDDYQGSLDILDRFSKRYWRPALPGTRAWVLMKLKRVDDAIKEAQMGLLRGAEPTRTFNILGILLSLKDRRDLALDAFGRAIKAEVSMGGLSQVSTPLSNAGEVYREMFKDEFAEAAWVRATQMPGGCEHILPSLNLTILYIDEMRLFQAERTLADFEACFAAQSFRIDTEHRTLLTLARGRIALRMGNVEKAVRHFEQALERQQWFGKIGTNENDVRFSATIGLAQASAAKASVLSDTIPITIMERLENELAAKWLRLRSWWLNRKARQTAILELANLEDLHIRNTDAMIEYPTLGTALGGFPNKIFEKRINHIIDEDPRELAHAYYRLYLGTNYLNNGNEKKALQLLQGAFSEFRPFDRLARAEAIAKIIMAKRSLSSYWWKSTEDAQDLQLKQELFELSPSHFRYHNLRLPVKLNIDETDEGGVARRLKNYILKHRFAAASADENSKYELQIELSTIDSGLRTQISLLDSFDNSTISSISGIIKNKESEKRLVNKFIAKTFQHKVDPPGEPLPEIPLLTGIFDQ